MTAVKSHKRHTPAREMMDHRQAWLEEDTPEKIVFKVYNREGDHKETVTINKSTLDTRCTCEYFVEWMNGNPLATDKDGKPKSCWHMRKGMYSYLLRIERGEVE